MILRIVISGLPLAKSGRVSPSQLELVLANTSTLTGFTFRAQTGLERNNVRHIPHNNLFMVSLPLKHNAGSQQRRSVVRWIDLSDNSIF